LTGTGGTSFAYYGDAAAAVKASLLNPNLNTGDAAGDSYVGINNLFGSRFADTLVGNNAGDQLNGALAPTRLLGEPARTISTAPREPMCWPAAAARISSFMARRARRRYDQGLCARTRRYDLDLAHRLRPRPCRERRSKRRQIWHGRDRHYPHPAWASSSGMHRPRRLAWDADGIGRGRGCEDSDFDQRDDADGGGHPSLLTERILLPPCWGRESRAPRQLTNTTT